MPICLPSRFGWNPRIIRRSSLAAVLLTLTLAALALPAQALELKNVRISSYSTGGSSTQTLRCRPPRADGTAPCELVARDGEVTARGTLKRRGRPARDAAAELATWRQIFADPAARATTTAKGPGIELRLTAPRRPVLIALLVPAVQSAREAARRSQAGRGDHTGTRTPTGAGGRGYTPVKGFTAVSEQDALTLRQLGGETATVPMKQGSCGLDCGTYVLAHPGGNLAAPFKISLACTPGKTAVYLAYRIEGQPVHSLRKVLSADAGHGTFSSDVQIEPFTAAELEKACQSALGGSWAKPNGPNNTSSTAHTHLAKTIRVWGRCSGETANAMKDFPVPLAVTCQVPGGFQPVP